MNNDVYWKARSYAFRLEPGLYRDLVHDAFLDYAVKRNKNLFDEPLGVIFRVIKNKFFDFLKAKYVRNYEEYNDHLITTTTPIDILEYQELDERIKGSPSMLNNNNSKPEILQAIIDLKLRGFTNTEVAEELNLSKALIGYYLKRLMSYINNPFTGKKEKGRSISLHQWEKLSDKEDYDLEDDNEFYILRRHKESKEGLLVKLPVAKTNQHIK